MPHFKVTVRLEQIVEMEVETDSAATAQTKALHLVKDEGEGNMVGESAIVTSIATME